MALENGIRLGPAIALTAAVAAILSAIPIYIAYSIAAALSATTMCGNQVAQTLPSPDGRFRAILFERDCGAMDGFSTQVSVLGRSQKLPNEAGNAFVAYDSTHEGPRGPWGGPNLVMRWHGSKLVLLRDPSADVGFAANQVQGVTILPVADRLPDQSN